MDACLAYGALISVIVSLLKRVPLVKSYPKWTAAVFSGAAAFLAASPIGAAGIGATLASVLPCIAAIFATSIAFHEVVVNTVTGDRAPGGV